MTHADHIEEAATELQLWMLPLILFKMIRSCFLDIFSGHAQRLNAMRRGKLPADWQDHHQRLRGIEWSMRILLAGGARQILSGQPLDLDAIPHRDPAADELWCPPHSAMATHLRFERIARFFADPEAAVRRHAAAIVRRLAACLAVRWSPHGEQHAKRAPVEPVRCDRRSRRIDPGDQFEQRTRLVPLALHPP